MKIREDIRFRASPDSGDHLFMIKSKPVFEFRGRHEVLDAGGGVIGMLEKDFRRSLLCNHWHVRDAAGTELLEAHEASQILALVRRFAELGPDYPPCSLAAVQLRAPPRRPARSSPSLSRWTRSRTATRSCRRQPGRRGRDPGRPR